MSNASSVEQLLDCSVAEFIERTGSASPTPGGGSVSALVGALASALVAMVARLTDRKKGYEQAWELAAEGVRDANRITAELQAAALEDVRSFEAYMAALRQPKRTPEERRARSAALAEATRHAVSDIGAAAHLAAAAAGAALLTAQINLSSAPDGQFFDDARSTAAELRKKTTELTPIVIDSVEKTL